MKRINDHLRSRIYAQSQLSPIGTFSSSDAEASHAEFFGEEGVIHWFIHHASARKLMGAFRYEQRSAEGLSYDEAARQGKAKTFIQRLIEKINLYEETGNQEFLVDAFNYLLLEKHRPNHPNPHYKSTERFDND